jgi:hypothetical protein
VKESAQETWSRRIERPLALPERLLCGVSAGLIGQFVTYPLDTCRRRMQVHGGGGGAPGVSILDAVHFD